MKYKTEVLNLRRVYNLNGRFKCTHKSQGRDRYTRVLVEVDDRYYVGNAECSDRDEFSRRKGRAIALGRAMKCFDGNYDIPLSSIDEDFRFRDSIEKR